MESVADSLTAAVLSLIVEDAIRIILAADLAVAVWVIYKLWAKLQEARAREVELHSELIEKITALEQRAWRLLADNLVLRRNSRNDQEP